MNLEIVYFSALLHDIGKFIERTKKYKDFDFNEFGTKGRYSHSRYGARWFGTIAQTVPLFKQMGYQGISNIQNLILTHHQPENLYGKVIQLADWLSSSERREEEEKSDLLYYRQGLRSIFSVIKDSGSEFYYGAEPLSFDSIFPKEKKEVDWGKLESKFEKELPKVDTEEKLLSLLELYTWCLPAQTGKYSPDVSLYDHLSTTAAFAVSLWHCVENGDLTESTLDKILKNPEDRDGIYFYLLGADLSGIQNFIFDIPSKNAAKSLKGRSLFLSLLTEVVSDYIIKTLGLKPVNILYRGGGNFQILLPSPFASKLEKIREEVSRIIFEALQDKIYLALEWVPVSLAEIFNKDIPKIYRKLGERLTEKKTKRYKEIIGEVFSIPRGISTYEAHCHICGENRKEHLYSDEICRMCHSFIELSEEVKRAKYLIKREIKPEPIPIFAYRDIFKKFGFELFFSEEKVPSSNNYNLYDFSLDGYRLGAYKTPQKTFEEMVEEKEKTKYLSYLKMDMDNLGTLFRGASTEVQSISRRATLSRMLRLFFTGCLPYKYQEREDVYILYSGGDDTFIIGIWDKILELAIEIRKDFERFVAKNHALSFSAGISLFPHHFPIRRAAEIVEDELSNAKNTPGKNRISIFSSPFKWKEYKDVLKLSDLFIEWAKKEKKKAFIHKIQMLSSNFSSIKEDFHHVGKPWEFVYALRKLDKTKLDELLKIVKAIWFWEKGDITVEISGSEYLITNPTFLNISARIAELKLREVTFNGKSAEKSAE